MFSTPSYIHYPPLSHPLQDWHIDEYCSIDVVTPPPFPACNLNSDCDTEWEGVGAPLTTTKKEVTKTDTNRLGGQSPGYYLSLYINTHRELIVIHYIRVE